MLDSIHNISIPWLPVLNLSPTVLASPSTPGLTLQRGCIRLHCLQFWAEKGGGIHIRNKSGQYNVPSKRLGSIEKCRHSHWVFGAQKDIDFVQVLLPFHPSDNTNVNFDSDERSFAVLVSPAHVDQDEIIWYFGRLNSAISPEYGPGLTLRFVNNCLLHVREQILHTSSSPQPSFVDCTSWRA